MSKTAKEKISIKKKANLIDIFLEVEFSLEEIIQFESLLNEKISLKEKRRRGWLGFLISDFNMPYEKVGNKIPKSIVNKLNLINEMVESESYNIELRTIANLIKKNIYSGVKIKDLNGNDSNIFLLFDAINKITENEELANNKCVSCFKTLIEIRSILVSLINELRTSREQEEIYNVIKIIIDPELERRIIKNDREIYKNRTIIDLIVI